MTTRFEVGKEYVIPGNNYRMRVTDVNDWGCAMLYIEGEYAGRYASCGHNDDHNWRPAPRTVERWIVVHEAGGSYAYATEKDAVTHKKNSPSCVINGPFKCVAP